MVDNFKICKSASTWKKKLLTAQAWYYGCTWLKTKSKKTKKTKSASTWKKVIDSTSLILWSHLTQNNGDFSTFNFSHQPCPDCQDVVPCILFSWFLTIWQLAATNTCKCRFSCVPVQIYTGFAPPRQGMVKDVIVEQAGRVDHLAHQSYLPLFILHLQANLKIGIAWC